MNKHTGLSTCDVRPRSSDRYPFIVRCDSGYVVVWCRCRRPDEAARNSIYVLDSDDLHWHPVEHGQIACSMVFPDQQTLDDTLPLVTQEHAKLPTLGMRHPY